MLVLDIASYIEHRRIMRERARERNRRNARELYYWRKERGLCVRCGQEPAQEGRVQCWRCRLNELDRRSVVYYREVDAQKTCKKKVA